MRNRRRSSSPKWREAVLTKLDTWAVGHGLQPEPFIRVKQAVIALSADVERKGELD